MQGKLAWHDVPQPVDNGGYPGNPSRVAVNDHPETAGNFSAVRHDADQAGILLQNLQLTRVSKQRQHAVAKQVDDGIVSGAEEEDQVRNQLLLIDAAFIQRLD